MAIVSDLLAINESKRRVPKSRSTDPFKENINTEILKKDVKGIVWQKPLNLKGHQTVVCVA